jgi:AraC-like DNA-binding protein
MTLLTELQTLIAFYTKQEQTTPPGVILRAHSELTDPLGYVVEPTFGLVAQGAKRTMLGEQAFNYGAGQYLIISADLPLTGHVVQASSEEPFLGFGLTLRPEAIAELLIESGLDRQCKAETLGIGINYLTDDLLDPVVRLVRLLDRPDDIPILAPSIEREIIWRLINGAEGAMVRQLGLADSRLAQVNRAIKWIRAHYSETLRVEDLAGIAGMSASTFHRHFRAITSMSPLQYQKQIRLQEARSLVATNATNIAAVGYAVGYDNPSQFSREYRRLFGLPPCEDGARLRASEVAGTQ